MTQPIALVTGSSRGIGAATAIRLARAGFAICINYRHNSQAAEAVAESIRELGVPCLSVQADVSSEAEVERLFQEIDGQAGQLAVLVNNAAIIKPQSPLTGISAERINSLLIANVTSTLLCSREAVKRMSTASGGAGGTIINVSSIAARTGSPNEYTDYAATKGAIDTFTRGLALEVANQGIRVNGVRPGLIYTDIHADGGEPGRVDRLSARIPLGRGGQVDEIADAIAWLASDQSSYVTGTLVDVDGGL